MKDIVKVKKGVANLLIKEVAKPDRTNFPCQNIEKLST
jgi:hypothetical protein